jgi:hypothetical protein
VSLDPAYLRQLLERFEKNSARQGGPPGPAPLRLDLLTGGQSVDQSLGFPAGAVAVDNHSAAYAYLQQIDRYVPPGKTGVAFPMNGETEVGLRFQAPPNVTQADPPDGQVCSFTFYPQGAAVSPASGVPTGAEHLDPQLGDPVGSTATYRQLLANADNLWRAGAPLPTGVIPAGVKGVAIYSGTPGNQLSDWTRLWVSLTQTLRNADGTFSPYTTRLYDSDKWGIPPANKLLLRFDDFLPLAEGVQIAGRPYLSFAVNPGANASIIWIFWLYDEPGAFQLLPGSVVQLRGTADVSDRAARLLGHVNVDDWSTDTQGGMKAGTVKVRDAGSNNQLGIGAWNNAWTSLRDSGTGTFLAIDGGGRALVRHSAYDQNGQNATNLNVVATLTFAAVAGKRYVAAHIIGSLAQTGATASTILLLLRDGASGVGAVLSNPRIGVDNVPGHADRIALSGLGIGGTSGSPMCLEMQAASLTCFQDVELGAYLE